MSEGAAVARRLPVPSAWQTDVRAALPSWIIARVIVLTALAVGRLIEAFRHGPPTAWEVFSQRGLLGWDADWYQRIAVDGYQALPRESLRFFPLFPLLARLFGATTWTGAGIALLVMANAAALACSALVHRLTMASGADAATARRAVACFTLAPPAFVLVMGYAEGLAIALALVVMIALLQRRSGPAIVAGVLAGLARPTGIALVVPALIVWFVDERGARWGLPGRERAARAAAVVAPAVGTALYLLWCQVVLGKWSLPFDVQAVPGLRGDTVNPFTTIGNAVVAFARLRFPASGHEVTVLLAVVLLVLGARRWPVAVTAWGTTAVLIAFTAQRLGSLERYVWGAVVPVMTLATVGGPRVQRAMPVVLGVGLAVLATLAFSGHYVP
jgi:hypothetical protein